MKTRARSPAPSLGGGSLQSRCAFLAVPFRTCIVFRSITVERPARVQENATHKYGGKQRALNGHPHTKKAGHWPPRDTTSTRPGKARVLRSAQYGTDPRYARSMPGGPYPVYNGAG
jgi:hypothetical protein